MNINKSIKTIIGNKNEVNIKLYGVLHKDFGNSKEEVREYMKNKGYKENNDWMFVK